MRKYLLNRFLQSLIAILGITMVVFFVLHLAGDPVDLLVPPSASIEDIERLRAEMGFDDPVMVQYARFMGNMLHGDLGMSYNYNEPALTLVLERLPATLRLTGAALFISLLFGIPAGVISAVKRNSRIDAVIRTLALLGQCLPAFWLGIIMILLFSVKLHWLPTSGNESWKSIIMPAFTLGVYTAATVTRLLRSNMIEVLSKEYIDTAKAKGLAPAMVIMKHAFKNAISTVLTVLGMQVALLLGGSVITETVFGWPGIGRLAVQSITNSDFNVVLAIVILMASGFVLINFIVDLLYSIINPRVKLHG